MSGRFEFIEHTAEVGIEATGSTCEEAFEAVAEAAATLLGAWFRGPGTGRRVALRSSDREALLAAWVDEILYLHESADVVFGGFTVERVTAQALEGEVTVAPRGGRTIEGSGVKAATYHRIFVGEENRGWVARVYVDV